MSLYIGTNYHPHDWPENRWPEDIELMKQAGVQIVRLGHLCWDSYEPEEGVYTFEWFDRVMDLFAQAGIKVFLDISMRPAPYWVHKLCPGCNICSKNGKEQASLHRYMEDVEDPAYQFYALRFAAIMVKRYRTHPALFAFGLCNELGDGQVSYSKYARDRFQNWLRKKYRTIERLNQAWATQRWSRRLSSFSDVPLMENEVSTGAPEAWLDMRRFFSDGIAGFLIKLRDTVKMYAPDVPVSCNLYSGRDFLGFDYLRYCRQFMEYPGMGFYPGYDLSESKIHHCLSICNEYINESGKPMWFLEFQTGRNGIFCPPKGYLRMLIMLGLLNRGQMFLMWSWRSMLGGEEQFHHGVLGHDGLPTPNYYELQKAAEDLKNLSGYAFPYLPQPEIGVAFHQESWWVTQYQKEQFRQNCKAAVQEVQKALYSLNKDYNMVDLRELRKHYKLLIVPDYVIMEQEAADTIRHFVSEGGTVIMTGYSAVENEHGQVFDIPKPGRLDDVFGIRVAGFYRTDMSGYFSENSVLTQKNGEIRELVRVKKDEDSVAADIDYYEELELKTAVSYAEFEGKQMPAITCNSYGKGKAYYVGTEANASVLKWLLQKIHKELDLTPFILAAEGVQVRKIAENHFFYVNTTSREVEISFTGNARGVLSGKVYEGQMVLEAYGYELLIR